MGSGRGGRRAGAGRKARTKPSLDANKRIAEEVLALCKRPIHEQGCDCDLCSWWELLHAKDQRLRFDVRKYLTDRRDGKPVQMLTHAGGGKESQPIRILVEHIGQRSQGSTPAQAK